jgi:four helix bundle protein
MQDFRNLTVWQQSHQLALALYRATEIFEKTETYGLRSQLRRSVVNIPTRIAEACGYSNDTEVQRSLFAAYGSATELEYQLLLAKDLGFVHEKTHEDLNAASLPSRRC